jgi:hypothetical protein
VWSWPVYSSVLKSGMFRDVRNVHLCRMFRHGHLNISHICVHISVLLSSMHSLGKMGENNFSAVKKLADLSTSTWNSDIHEHPAFGFKSCLVQMLGNLCWRHRENQNQVSSFWVLLSFILRTKVSLCYVGPLSLQHGTSSGGDSLQIRKIAANMWIRSHR